MKLIILVLLVLAGFGISYLTYGYYGIGYRFGFPITFITVMPCQVPPCPEEFYLGRYFINSLIWTIFLYLALYLVKKFKKG